MPENTVPPNYPNALINSENKMAQYSDTENTLMLFPEIGTAEFNFDTMLGDKSYQTICGCPVRIDKILRDTTKTTVLGVSGTMVVRGVKIRGVWDCYGNIMECQKTLQLTSPRCMLANIDNIFRGATESMFRLVSVTDKNEAK